MKKITKFLLLFLITYTSQNCKKQRKCESPLNVNQSSLEVIFKDKMSDKYLYAEANPLYNKDSLKIFDANGNQLFLLYSLREIPNTSSRYWRINFGPLYNSQTDMSSFNTDICKKFIVKYSINQLDTIEACFKSKETDCGSFFETLKIYNKGILISTESNQTDSQITILKN